MVTTNMNWSGPNCVFLAKWITFRPDQFILVVTKSLWSSPNQFGKTKTILDRPKLFWSHRRTRHKLPTKGRQKRHFDSQCHHPSILFLKCVRNNVTPVDNFKEGRWEVQRQPELFHHLRVWWKASGNKWDGGWYV